MSGRFGQLLTAMITPFTENGAVDYLGVEKLASKLVADGNDGLVICGTTGEAPTLSSEEKIELWQVVRKTIGPKVPLIAGTGSYCTSSTIELSNRAQKAGADALLVVAPYYNKPSGKGMLEHFRAVHDATELPLMLYNIPGRTGVEIPVEVLVELSELPRVVAVKQSLPIDPVSRLIARLAARGVQSLDTYSGDDSQTLPQLAVGGVGVVSVASHVATKEIKAMITAFAAGNVAEATRIHKQLFALFEVLFITSNPVPVKIALKLLGLPAGPVRQPLWDATDEQKARIELELRKLELIA